MKKHKEPLKNMRAHYYVWPTIILSSWENQRGGEIDARYEIALKG